MINRSNFICVIGLIIMFLMFIPLRAGELEHAKINFWKNGTFHQQTVDLSKYDQGIIMVKTYGKEYKWEEYKISKVPDEFLTWNIKSRMESLEKLKKNEFPSFGGPHNAMIATHGIRRFDTQFAINNAVKGMGFLPKKENLKETIELLQSTINKDMKEKIDVLKGLYDKTDKVFDRTKQISLELYSTPEFETQSFLNQMFNPRVAIVFLDIPCFKIKTIAQLFHPDDPQLTPYEKDILEYVNLIHSYFHGKFSKKFIVAVYHVIEVYDNSPGKKGKGVRIVPEKQLSSEHLDLEFQK